MTRAFATTRWSLVLDARRGDAAGRAALEELCAAYWGPLYAFVRRSGLAPADAEDAIQGFFAKLLEKDYLGDFEPERGRLRTFLLAALRHHVSNERDRAHARRRGGGVRIVPIDAASLESQGAFEPRHGITPEDLFERDWTLAVLARARARLRAEHAEPGRRQRYDALEPLLVPGGDVPHADVAATLGMAEGALRVSLHRLRRRFASLLREEVAEGLANPSQVDEEIRRLLAAVSAPTR